MRKILPLILIFIFAFSGFLVPQSASAAPGDLPAPSPERGATVSSNELKTEINCSLDPTTWVPCFSQKIVKLIFEATSALLAVTGKLFDSVISFSLNSANIDLPFVGEGWGVVRDIANIGFIFILLYISISTILQISGHGAKELLVKVIIFALLVNFSLFITKMVIDTSNVLASQFYHGITVSNPEGGSASARFVKGFSPQNLITGSVPTAGLKTLDYLLIHGLASALNIVSIYALLVAGLLFIGRLVALYFLMITSPLAFVASILPKTRSFASKWWSTLFTQAFVAPVFLFLFMVVLMIAKTSPEVGVVGDVSTGGGLPGDTFTSLLNTTLKAAVMLVALLMAVKVSKNMSGEIGSKALSVGKTVGGVAAGAMAGGAVGMMGRQTLGRLARNISEREGVKDFAAKSKFGAMTLRGAQDMSKASFDVRGIAKSPKELGKVRGAGGFAGVVQKQTEKEQSLLSSLKGGDGAARRAGMYAQRAVKTKVGVPGSVIAQRKLGGEIQKKEAKINEKLVEVEENILSEGLVLEDVNATDTAKLTASINKERFEKKREGLKDQQKNILGEKK